MGDVGGKGSQIHSSGGGNLYTAPYAIYSITWKSVCSVWPWLPPPIWSHYLGGTFLQFLFNKVGILICYRWGTVTVSRILAALDLFGHKQKRSLSPPSSLLQRSNQWRKTSISGRGGMQKNPHPNNPFLKNPRSELSQTWKKSLCKISHGSCLD